MSQIRSTSPINSDFKKFTSPAPTRKDREATNEGEEGNEGDQFSEQSSHREDTPKKLAVSQDNVIPLRPPPAPQKLRAGDNSLVFIQLLEKWSGSRNRLIRFLGAGTYQAIRRIQKTSSIIRKGSIIDQKSA